MASRHDFHKVIIGRSEMLTFVDAEAVNVPAKTDSGAYRSAVHASDIHVKGGVLHFTLLGGHPVCGDMAREMTTEQYEKVDVINSFGQSEKRFEVKLKVKVGPKVFVARFTLADRSKLIYPVLLGRKLLNDRFLVDSSKSSIDRRELKVKHNVVFPVDEETKWGDV